MIRATLTGQRDRRTPQPRRRVISLTVTLALVALAAQQPAAARGASGYDWLQFDGTAQHSGNNTAETLLSTSTVSGLHRLFTATLPDVADTAPAYLSAVTTTMGVKDLLYITTKAGSIVALDAHTGAQIWAHQYGPGQCHINNGASPCYTTSSPAVGPGRSLVYTYGLDGRLHRLTVGSGRELTGSGWPQLVTRKAFDEKGSSALTIASANGTNYLYAASAGYPGDRGDYQGHITTINLLTGAQSVFNMLCSNQVYVHFREKPLTPDCPQVQSAVWSRPGVIYDPASGKVYAATGNGDYNPANSDWGDSVVALSPNGVGATGGLPFDSYTPSDYQFLQNSDEDLGSTAPAILPVPAGSSVRHLAVQSGKDAVIRLLNLDNLSGQGGPGHTGGEVGATISVPQGGEVLTQPSVWVNPRDNTTWVFIANDNGISGLQLTVSSGVPALHAVWQDNSGGSSPLVANGVLYEAGNGGIRALDPTNGLALWSDSSIGGIHWQSPIVDNGVLYIADNNGSLTAYGL